jgi:hypothetical protein
MEQHRQDNFMIEKMAKDLGLPATGDPIKTILKYCERRIQELCSPISEFKSLIDMLDMAANKVGTTFKVINTNEDLVSVSNVYLNRNEKAFATLEAELSEDVFGVTYKLQERKKLWELPFVSVIDCRGAKAARAYFTKWHEVAHLLTLTEPARLVFKRTHTSPEDMQDPEERLMDTIAGKLGFLAGLTHKYIEREISFNEIERLRMLLCHEASRQAAIINFVKYWPSPCIHLRAEVALTKTQNARLRGQSLDSIALPEPTLRAVRVVPNEQAHARGFLLFDGVSIPERSVVYRTFMRGNDYEEAVEDLSWWKRSSFGRVKVKAKAVAGSVEALIIPLD